MEVHNSQSKHNISFVSTGAVKATRLASPRSDLRCCETNPDPRVYACLNFYYVCVYSREENYQSKTKPWLHFNPETPASSERRWDPERFRLQKRCATTNFTGKIAKSFPAFDESLFLRCHGRVKMGRKKWPVPPESTTERYEEYLQLQSPWPQSVNTRPVQRTELPEQPENCC